MNERKYTTGNATVDAVGSMHFSGNIVPHIWYKTITKENGRPYLLAIAILSDIVYWYRPVEVRDEITGQLITYKKRFSQDILQRSYEQIAEMFGETKRSVTNAIIRLEELGIVKRVFRTVEFGGLKCSNALFLELNSAALYRVTFPEECISEADMDMEQDRDEINHQLSEGKAKATETGVSHFSEKGITEKRKGCPQKKGDPSLKKGTSPPKKRETNTKNITKNITETISSSIKIPNSISISKVPEAPEMDEDQIIRNQIGYAVVLRIYPEAEELVEMVYEEIKKRQDDILPILNQELFRTICQNIILYSRDVRNGPAYIQRCLDNLLSGLQISSLETERRKHKQKQQMKKNTFNDFQQNSYDFEQLEKELLGEGVV